MKPGAPITIDGWQIDADRFCIMRDGIEKKLEPRSMELLLYLAERPAEVVTRQQIEDDVWQGRVVGYDALSGSIAKIRKAFDDDPKSPRIIETIPKAGYRLIGRIDSGPSRETATPGSAPTGEHRPERVKTAGDKPRNSKRVAAITAIAIVFLAAFGITLFESSSWFEATDDRATSTAIPSLAVLPFRSLGQDPEQQFYSDGLTDDLITDLSNIPGLQVSPRHQSQAYGADDLHPFEAARELGVRYVVQGSVRRSFDEIRVNIQMIDTQDETEVWARRFDDDIRNAFKLQDQIVREIIHNAGLKIENRVYSRRGTTSLEAYDFFLRAEHRRQNDSGLVRDGKTAELYRQAIELDPTYVNAYNGLARESLTNWQLNANQVMPPAVSRKMVYQSAGKALEIEPDNAEALSILGLLQAISGEHDAGIGSIERAIGSSSANPRLLLDHARALSYSGDHVNALESIQRAIELEPELPAIYFVERAKIYFFLDKLDQALADTRQGTRIRDPRNFSIFIHGAARSPASRRLAAARLELNPWENQQYYATIYAYYRRPEDIDRIIAAAAYAGIPRLAYGFEADERQALAAAEIRKLVAAGLWHGNNHDQREFFLQATSAERVAMRTSDLMLSGPYRIEDDRLCVSFESVLLDFPDCGPLYHDPGIGTYSWVTLGDVYRFSVEN